MNSIFHKADDRGVANYGWLNTKYSFSFANYQNREKTNFGLLRVLNDDLIKPGGGFGMHPHENFEIITIPLKGAVEHKDNMNHTTVIKTGDIQVMSAGKGIMHSEYNHSSKEDLKLFQIWIFPRANGLKPRYDQKSINWQNDIDEFTVLVNPDFEKGLFIQQDAWLSMGKFKSGKKEKYKIKKTGNGLYVMNVEGKIKADDHLLEKRDAVGFWNTNQVELNFENESTVLLIDVPME